MKKLIIMAFAAAALTALTAMSVSAASPITISDAEINASSTEGESVVDFACQSTQVTEQFSMILTSEELSETIAFDKIVSILNILFNCFLFILVEFKIASYFFL